MMYSGRVVWLAKREECEKRTYASKFRIETEGIGYTVRFIVSVKPMGKSIFETYECVYLRRLEGESI